MASPYIITLAQITKARLTFQKNEPRDLFYRAATELIRLSIKRKTTLSVVEALAVLLQTWNSGYYRFHRKFDTRHFEKIENLYRQFGKTLISYRHKKIDSLVERDKPIVSNMFKEFENVLGAVGASKTLHLLAPNFFPLWDNAIAAHYKTRIGKQGSNNERYWQFMNIARLQFLRLNGKCDDILKRIDEYNYCSFTMELM
jgi:hypothetical protein